MAFSPFARVTNFTVKNLKGLLEVYPSMAKDLSWGDAYEIIESAKSGFKRSYYQLACQFGLEDKGRDNFRIQSYLYTFEDEQLEKYIQFWMKTYYAPNPYVNSDDPSMIIYVEIAKEILSSSNHEIDYYEFFNRRIGGKSDDILLNALKSFCEPIKYKKIQDKDILYVDANECDFLENEIKKIEEDFPIIDSKDKKIFFDRFRYENYCKFHGILINIPEPDFSVEEGTLGKRKTGGENILLYGVPGSGKSHTIQRDYCSDSRFIERVVFHPDYTYSDFVGQILPRVINGSLKYVFTAGPFTNVMRKAWQNPSQMFYLVIEELNRGNAPAIFGEIFQLLDRKEEDKYLDSEIGESEYGITNYDVAKEVYGTENHLVRIPSNLTILATMNTADQNVFTLDTAFQRRWDMRQIENDFTKEENRKQADLIIAGTNISWGAFATTINELIIENNMDMASSEDKRLGTYFVKFKELEPKKFSEKVLKYLWDDAFKMEKDTIFRTENKSLEDVIMIYEKTTENRLEAVLRTEVYKKMLDKMKINPESSDL